ncbi:MAG: hypothetical protein LVS60_02430 [Nodosilinea sp. LVE1205-7]|jgi:HlyD family secretion protein
MAFPFSGQQRSLPLWLGALLAGTMVLTVGIGVLIWRSRSTPYDINSFTTVASLQPLTVRVSASGRVKPGQTVNLSPANAGIVEHLYVEQGIGSTRAN